jgi:putative ABC transport system permease protein
MKTVRSFLHRLRNLFRKERLERELNDELAAHLELHIADNLRAGMSPEEARRAALLRLGGVEQTKESVRERRGLPLLESFFQDLRFALRMLRKSPGITLLAVLALALGMGADTAMYSIVVGSLSWDMGLDNRDQIVIVTGTNTARSEESGISYPDFRDLRSQTKSLEGLAAYQFAPVNLSDRNALPERYFCAQMSANGFSVVGQKPLLGRDFIAADEQPGAPAVLIIAYHVWRDRYAQDSAIIGKSVRVDEVPRLIVGVMPPHRRFPEEADLWTPLVPDAELEKRDNRSLMLFGRLEDGPGVPSVRAEFSAMAGRLAVQYPDTNKDITAEVRPILEITGLHFLKPLFWALFGAVGFVLLIACVDVATMLLSRAAERSREISIRMAIGGRRIRVIRELLLESVLLSIAGGLFGWWVALGGLRWFDSGLGTLPKPAWLHLTLDRGAFLYLAAISIATGILFGLAPALQLAKTDIMAVLKDAGGNSVVGSKFGLRLSNVLVAIQMASCVVLLAGAGLMTRSALNLYDAPIGVNTADLLTMRINLPEAKYSKPESWIAFHEDLQNRLTALPGVEQVTLSSQLPLGGWDPLSIEFNGRDTNETQPVETGGLVVGNNYFQTMQVQPRRGWLLLAADGVAGPPVIVVNESFAAKFWPGEDALGKRLRLIEDHTPGPWQTVVGVVPDILQNFRQNLQHDPLLYLPFAEKPERQVFLVARTRVQPGTLADPFRREVQRIDENLAVYDVRTLQDRIAESRLTVSLFGTMCAIFAGVAMLLAVIGLYGVTAHAVSQRRQEIALRMVVGATARDILRLVLAQAARPLVLGLTGGLLLALVVTRLLRVALVGVSPSDPLTFFGIVVVLTAAATLGCFLPTRRAMRVDPMIALRYE